MSSLAKYRKMRDFARTEEPRGKPLHGRPRPKTGPSFVVQKHDARNLHYDFRLELDGVLLSWAVPKGPSIDPTVKRLAMEVEPHPIEYGGFEGTIPDGEYGGGTVMLWDRGSWLPEGDPHQALAKGHLKFTLKGTKLKGGWHLVRTRGRGAGASSAEGSGKPWLLFKSRDEEAQEGETLLDDAPLSVLTGRDLTAIANETDEKHTWHSDRKVAATSKVEPKAKAKAAKITAKGAKTKASKPSKGKTRSVPPASAIKPALATLVEEVPTGDDWVHEIKFDGYRMLARVAAGKVSIFTRNGKDWTERMPTLEASLAQLNVDSAVLDGELVALDAKGVSSFQGLQNSLSDGRDGALVYYAFDLLHLDGQDLTGQPLVERKSRLRELLEQQAETLAGKVRLSAHVVGNGPEFFANACKLGLEGTIAKRAESPYRAGRGRDWLKIKCNKRQEFAVIGYTEPSGSRSDLGALLLGVEREGELSYAGRVGTGFSEASLAELAKKLAPLATKKPAVVNPPTGADARGVHWVEPRLVAEVRFVEMTSEGLLRHPTFQGLREDKPASDVKLETAKPLEPAKRVVTKKATTSYPITNPDKVLYPEVGVTKRELLEYYALAAEHMLPQVANRPLTLVRCPNGWGKSCFFQKHPGEGVPKGLRSVSIREKEGKAPYSVIDDAAGIFGLVQLGALEIHTWGSRADDFEHPDVLVFDLDPDEKLAYEAVIRGAQQVRQIFESAKLRSFVKTTGGKGLHVCIPIAPDLSWDIVKDFTGSIAEAMAKASPELYVATQSKAARTGKTFIDYLRNGRGATFIAPYSTRARAGAPIAVPLEWDELSPKLPPNHFNVRNIAARLARLTSDPWAGMAEAQALRPGALAAAEPPKPAPKRKKSP